MIRPYYVANPALLRRCGCICTGGTISACPLSPWVWVWYHAAVFCVRTMVEHDAHVGLLLKQLADLGSAETTIVMYATDDESIARVTLTYADQPECAHAALVQAARAGRIQVAGQESALVTRARR
jgi:hypothetical protein